jgi:hypothetical protein
VGGGEEEVQRSWGARARSRGGGGAGCGFRGPCADEVASRARFPGPYPRGAQELSPALSNRFTTVWVPGMEDEEELRAILESRLACGCLPFALLFMLFQVVYYICVNPLILCNISDASVMIG